MELDGEGGIKREPWTFGKIVRFVLILWIAIAAVLAFTEALMQFIHSFSRGH